MVEIPTPAIEAEPSLPTHIMSIVGPIMLRLWLIIIGQEKDHRLPPILPFVQSLSCASLLTVNTLPFYQKPNLCT
jgi:hypothetical protein